MALLGGVVLGVLDVQVASLLGVLVLDSLAQFLFGALGLVEGGLDVEFLLFEDLTVELGDGGVGALGSVFVVVGVRGHEADEGEFTIGVVLLVQVVSDAAHIGTILGLEGNSDAVLVLLVLLEHFGGERGIFGVLIGDETVASGGVVLVHGDLEG